MQLRLWKKLRSIYSLQTQIVLLFIILVLPAILMLVYYNFYAYALIRDQVANSNKDLLKMYLNTVDKGLEDVDTYLYNMVARESDLLFLDRMEQTDPEIYNLARIRLFNKLSTDLNNYAQADLLFIYSEKNDDLLSVESKSLQLEHTRELKKQLYSILIQGTKPPDNEWMLFNNNESSFIYRSIKYGGVYIGAVTRIDKLMAPFKSTDLVNVGNVLLVDGDYNPVINELEVHQDGIQIRPSEELYYMTGDKKQFMLVNQKSSRGNFSVYSAIPEEQIMKNMPYPRHLVMLVVVGTVIILPIVYFFMRKFVLVPMHRIISAMRRIRSGDIEARIPPLVLSNEFLIVNETFNSMMDQIKELKIYVYEEQLSKQRAELKHIQLQVNPHFFLNSLNILYHLAEVKNYKLIQEMSLSLVQHFRFIFRSNMNFVLLKEELEHTRNYLTIQQLRFPDRLSFSIEMEESLSASVIPPLVCQTFVENCIKYAVSMDSKTYISIQVYTEEDNPAFMWIEIKDTGKGFSADILEKLQHHIDLADERGSRIGIQNARNRLRLLYKNQEISLIFANDKQQGAIVKIRLPIWYSETAEVE